MQISPSRSCIVSAARCCVCDGGGWYTLKGNVLDTGAIGFLIGILPRAVAYLHLFIHCPVEAQKVLELLFYERPPFIHLVYPNPTFPILVLLLCDENGPFNLVLYLISRQQKKALFVTGLKPTPCALCDSYRYHFILSCKYYLLCPLGKKKTTRRSIMQVPHASSTVCREVLLNLST